MRQILNSDLASTHNYLSGAALRAGQTFRTLHEMGYAYMDGYQGNMSYYKDQQGDTLYITDLGSCKNVAQETYKDKYYGFDFFMYLTSLNNILTDLTPRVISVRHPRLNPAQESVRLLYTTVSSLIYGYFSPEIENKYKLASPAKIEDVMSDKAIDLIQAFFMGSQRFIDFFPSYKVSFTS